MDDLRQLRARLEGVKKVTEADLQQNVFKFVPPSLSSPK